MSVVYGGAAKVIGCHHALHDTMYATCPRDVHGFEGVRCAECPASAAARWALMDGDDTDFPSVEAMGLGHVLRWPEPNDRMAPELTIQLYWPLDLAEGAGGESETVEVVRVDGDLACEGCGTPLGDHPFAPFPLDYTGERFLHRLCDGTLGKT